MENTIEGRGEVVFVESDDPATRGLTPSQEKVSISEA